MQNRHIVIQLTFRERKKCRDIYNQQYIKRKEIIIIRVYYRSI